MTLFVLTTKRFVARRAGDRDPAANPTVEVFLAAANAAPLLSVVARDELGLKEAAAAASLRPVAAHAPHRARRRIRSELEAAIREQAPRG